jgi:hypothetical protein
MPKRSSIRVLFAGGGFFALSKADFTELIFAEIAETCRGDQKKS